VILKLRTRSNKCQRHAHAALAPGQESAVFIRQKTWRVPHLVGPMILLDAVMLTFNKRSVPTTRNGIYYG
jgi:hypothetical protein